MELLITLKLNSEMNSLVLSNPVCVHSASITEHVVYVLAPALMLFLTVPSTPPCACCHSLPCSGDARRQLTVPAATSVQRVLFDGVEDPVHLRRPAAMMRVIHLLCEILQSLLLSFV